MGVKRRVAILYIPAETGMISPPPPLEVVISSPSRFCPSVVTDCASKMCVASTRAVNEALAECGPQAADTETTGLKDGVVAVVAVAVVVEVGAAVDRAGGVAPPS